MVSPYLDYPSYTVEHLYITHTCLTYLLPLAFGPSRTCGLGVAIYGVTFCLMVQQFSIFYSGRNRVPFFCPYRLDILLLTWRKPGKLLLRCLYRGRM